MYIQQKNFSDISNPAGDSSKIVLMTDSMGGHGNLGSLKSAAEDCISGGKECSKKADSSRPQVGLSKEGLIICLELVGK